MSDPDAVDPPDEPEDYEAVSMTAAIDAWRASPVTTEVVADEALPRPSAATIIAMAGELPPRTFRVWFDAHDG